LEKTNARTTLANARISRVRAAQELATYLNMEPSTDIELIIPTVAGPLHINAAEAIAYARENNPQYLESRQTTAEARREAERARVEKNLRVSLDASIGLNQVADRFADAYRHLLSQDMATVTLSIPLKDWGKRRNAYLAAQSHVEAAERAEQERARDTELDVALTVADFNERQAIVETARQALTIAEDAYAQTLQRFIRAQADAYSLSVAQGHWQTARQNKIASLQNYWMAYYHLRRLTLYDYQRHQTITHK
jgi:outer membrane protein TolC